mmetsp:Transcript_100333/g.289688  ORF Transcript_100333/g.289688 Transcript_100333/m.289688 type:complete len:298 (+) Transcript_100333:1961-2854(+)
MLCLLVGGGEGRRERRGGDLQALRERSRRGSALRLARLGARRSEELGARHLRSVQALVPRGERNAQDSLEGSADCRGPLQRLRHRHGAGDLRVRLGVGQADGRLGHDPRRWQELRACHRRRVRLHRQRAPGGPRVRSPFLAGDRRPGLRGSHRRCAQPRDIGGGGVEGDGGPVAPGGPCLGRRGGHRPRGEDVGGRRRARPAYRSSSAWSSCHKGQRIRRDHNRAAAGLAQRRRSHSRGLRAFACGDQGRQAHHRRGRRAPLALKRRDSALRCDEGAPECGQPGRCLGGRPLDQVIV